MGDHIESEMDLAHPEIKHLDGHGPYSTCPQFGDIAEEEAADAYDALSDEVLELREEVGALRRSVLEAYMELRSPFNALEFYLANGGVQALTPRAPLVLPPTLRPNSSIKSGRRLRRQ